MVKPMALLTVLAFAGLSGPQGASASQAADNEAAGCKMAADHMIAFGRQALANPRSRPERTRQRAKLDPDYQ